MNDCVDKVKLLRALHMEFILQEKHLLGPWRSNPGTNMNKGY